MDTLPPPEHAADTQQTDRGKRLATSPITSPNKEPLAKKQLWSAVVAGTNSTQQTPSLAVIPATNNAVTEVMLKSMLLTLQQDLHRELQISMSQMHDRIDCLEERADVMEENLQDYSKAHNEVLDVQEHHTEELRRIKVKLADLEDRA